jgi:hypothetical protein
VAGPSVRGAALKPVVEQLRELVRKGRLSEAERLRQLAPEDEALFQEPIDRDGWYPIRSHDRCLRLLRDVAGEGSDEYLVEFACLTAQEMLSVPPFDSLVRDSRALGARAGLALVKLAELVFDFSQWTYEGRSADRFRVHVNEARDLPETARYTAQGFIRYVATMTAGRAVRVNSERVARDRIVFRGVPGR